MEATGTLVVVEAGGLGANSGLEAVIRVDPQTGDRTLVSGRCVDPPMCTISIGGGPIGSGPVLTSPRAIAVEADGSLVVVDEGFRVTGGFDTVIRVDPVTGDRTIVDFEGFR